MKNLKDVLKDTFTYKLYELKLAWIDFKIELFALDTFKCKREKLIEDMNLFLKEN